MHVCIYVRTYLCIGNKSAKTYHKYYLDVIERTAGNTNCQRDVHSIACGISQCAYRLRHNRDTYTSTNFKTRA